jgi:hypothetical protein
MTAEQSCDVVLGLHILHHPEGMRLSLLLTRASKRHITVLYQSIYVAKGSGEKPAQ